MNKLVYTDSFQKRDDSFKKINIEFSNKLEGRTDDKFISSFKKLIVKSIIFNFEYKKKFYLEKIGLMIQ